MSRRTVVKGLAAASLHPWGGCAPDDESWKGLGDCGPRLTAEHVDRGIALAAGYLIAAWLPAGDFEYEVDWRTGERSAEVSPVRQAGAAWGLTDHAVETGDPASLAAADRAIDHWLGKVRAVPDGLIFNAGRAGQLGTVVLGAFALAERLRRPEGLDPARAAKLRETLDGLLAFVRASRRPEGGFTEKHHVVTGDRSGPSSPYADGEALLLFSTLAVRDGRAELLADALAWAEQDHALNVAGPLASAADPDTTKGYYQWGSMSWDRLIEGGHDVDRWGRRLTDLAVWMVDVHATLKRSRNTAYAYEGLLCGYAEAKRRGDAALARKLACVSHQGLRKLCAWQLGHPLATGLSGFDPKYAGGVQNLATEPELRIDVTQHQLHALHLAKRTGVVDHPL